MKSKHVVLLAFCVSAIAVIPASAAGITVAVMPAQSSVAVNGVTQIDLTISGLGNMTAPSLSAFDLDLTFNPAIVSVTNALFGSSSAPFDELNLSGSTPITQVDQSTPGELHLQEVSLDSASLLDSEQLGAFTLAEITLRGTQPGNTQLSLIVNTLGDSQGNPLFVSGLSGANLTVTGSTATPEPGSFMLFGVALLGLLCSRPVRNAASLILRDQLGRAHRHLLQSR